MNDRMLNYSGVSTDTGPYPPERAMRRNDLLGFLKGAVAVVVFIGIIALFLLA